MFTHSSFDSLPKENFIWEEENTGNPRKSDIIRRLYPDGRLFSWSNTRRIINNGQPGREQAEYAWRLDAKITETGIQNINNFIESEFIKIAKNDFDRPASNNGYGGITWRAFYNGQLIGYYLPAHELTKLPEILKNIENEIQSNIIVGGVPFEQEH